MVAGLGIISFQAGLVLIEAKTSHSKGQTKSRKIAIRIKYEMHARSRADLCFIGDPLGLRIEP